MWVNVSRKYYIKGSDEFKNAKYSVKASDWDAAKEIWNKYINDPDPKIASYALYNMALASEIEGDLDAAYDWAKKSYNKTHSQSSYYYMQQLKNRINDQHTLQQQMKKE